MWVILVGSTALYIKQLSHLLLLKEKSQQEYGKQSKACYLQVIISSSSEIQNREIALKSKMKHILQSLTKLFLLH